IDLFEDALLGDDAAEVVLLRRESAHQRVRALAGEEVLRAELGLHARDLLLGGRLGARGEAAQRRDDLLDDAHALAPTAPRFHAREPRLAIGEGLGAGVVDEAELLPQPAEEARREAGPEDAVREVLRVAVRRVVRGRREPERDVRERAASGRGEEAARERGCA